MVQQPGEIYFISFTCFRWKCLFELANAYDSIYKWFDYLTERQSSIIGYVIMPNHLHTLFHLPASKQSLNTIISNGKRFLAYDIIKIWNLPKMKRYCRICIYR